MKFCEFTGSAFYKLIFAGLSLTLISACESVTDFDDFMAGASTHQISMPSYEDTSDPEAAKAPRIRVSKIEISAPAKGHEVVVMRGSVQPRGHKRRAVQAEYVLAADLEPEVRLALDHLFEIDPNAERSVNAIVTAAGGSFRMEGDLCKVWVTNVRIGLELAILESDGSITEKSYKSRARDETCPIMVWFPYGAGIDSAVDEAFQETMDKAIADRGAIAR